MNTSHKNTTPNSSTSMGWWCMDKYYSLLSEWQGVKISLLLHLKGEGVVI
jgi:hypothetical protein